MRLTLVMHEPVGTRQYLHPIAAQLSTAPVAPVQAPPIQSPPCPSPTIHRHSLHAIAAQLSPLPHCSGIELLESETFDLHCFETPTGEWGGVERGGR